MNARELDSTSVVDDGGDGELRLGELVMNGGGGGAKRLTSATSTRFMPRQ